MNICVLSGTMQKDPVGFADGRVIKFLLKTTYRFPFDSSREGTTTVPCTLFDPSSLLRSQFLDSKIKGRRCQCRGRIQRSSFEGADGQRRFSTDVIVDPNSVIIKSG